jgi:hypothetical protein
MQMGALRLDPDVLLGWYVVVQLGAMWLWSVMFISGQAATAGSLDTANSLFRVPILHNFLHTILYNLRGHCLPAIQRSTHTKTKGV